MDSISPENQTTAWELCVGGTPRQTSALNGNILRLALSREPFQGVDSFAKFLTAISEVSRLLWFLHQEGIVHRDIKPDHILLSHNSVTLIGFLRQPKPNYSVSVDASFIGTPGYAPPEQARGEEVLEPRSDIFSLGAVLYEALVHQPPFRGANLLAFKLATLTEDPPPIHKFCPHCPDSLVSLCGMMLAKDPAIRPNAEEVQHRLLAIAKDCPALSIALFSDKKNVPVSSPSPAKVEKTEPDKFSTEELLNRLLPLRPPPLKQQPLDTRSPGAAPHGTPKGRYFLEHELGLGGIGRVSQAHDQRLQRPVAIKELLNPEDEEAKERFLREALLTARLQHPAIVPIYDVGVRTTGEIFYSMRLISGKPLNELCEEKPFYERMVLLPHLLLVSEAIAYAHSQKIIHRDLKPQNILVGEFGETMVIDWGLAKDLSVAEPVRKKTPKNPIEVLALQEYASKTPDLTIDGSIIGTPAYMAPEQALGQKVKETADVFALGAILYHLVAGKAPVRDKDQLMKQVQEGVFVPLKEVEPETPEELLTIVQKAMAKNPEDRYQTAISFAEDLRRYQKGQFIHAHQYSLRERFLKYLKKHKNVFAVSTAALLMMAVGGAYSIRKIVHEKDVTRQSLNNIMLLQARSELSRNPAKSLGWLKGLPPDFPQMDEARMIASDAIHRGVPYTIDNQAGRVNQIFFSTSGALLSGSTDGSIRYWNPSTREVLKILQASSGGVIQFDLSKDENTLAAVYNNGLIRVWDTTRNIVLAELEASSKSLTAFCSISPDGKWVASTGDDGTSYLWEISTQQKTTLFQSADKAHNLQFSPDGKTIAIPARTGEYSAVQLYDITTKTIRTLPLEETNEILFVQFSKSGRFLAASGQNGALYLWDTSNQSMKKLEGHKNTVSEAIFSPNETTLATGGQDKNINVWNTNTGTLVSSYKEHEGSIRSLAFSNNGKLLVSASGDKTVRIWNLTNNQHRILQRHEDVVSSVAFSSDDTMLFSGGFDSLLLLWEIEPNDRRLLFQQEEPVFAVAISDDASLVASQKNQQVVVWPTKTFEEIELGPTSTLAIGMSFSPDNQLLAVSDVSGNIIVFNIKQKSFQNLNQHSDIVQKIQFIDNKTLISASNDKTIKIWDLENNKTITFSGHKDIIPSFVVTSDQKIISAGQDGELKIWDIQTQRLVRSLELGDLASDVSLSHDEKFLAVVTPSSAVRVYELGSLLSEKPAFILLEGHKDQATRVSFIGESHLLLSASADSTLRIWDANNKESSVLMGHSGMVVGLAVAHDQKVAISSGVDGSVRLWWDNIPEETPAFLQWLQTTPSAPIPDNIIPE